ncbi:cytochrome d ubiquinol oxidase subunit II [Mycolicibacter icosiumassiliensis]|uniref:cytochrome d ubiquinol oxidase subunit II n=1 Tax=Mycolicibacter icosiumassiliensis TaxID=1792835 RepID=UPI00082BC911|nr:cytochrome d ubiquinol oxidase subunit II [Mycolicibacter icosiumassiliensis]
MGLQELWFVILAVLFLGFLVLEGFDFGVGMLMAPLGQVAKGDPEAHRRAALNTIGPVWDGNEVWLITAGAAMFAAFPNWYATVFSALYLPLLAIVIAMILRVVAIEWRGKIDDARWRRWADLGIAMGSWLPAALWGVAFAVLVRGLPVDGHHRVHLTFADLINPYTVLGGLATTTLFLFYGAVFLVLKTAQGVREDALRFATVLSLPTVAIVGAFGLWTQLGYGKNWTWLPLVAAVLALLTAVGLVWRQWAGLKVMTGNPREGWTFVLTLSVVALVVVLLFGSMYPNLVPSTLNPDFSVTIYNGSSTHYTLKIMTWAAVLFAPAVVVYQAWTYWVFRRRISAEAIPESVGLPRTAGGLLR